MPADAEVDLMYSKGNTKRVRSTNNSNKYSWSIAGASPRSSKETPKRQHTLHSSNTDSPPPSSTSSSSDLTAPLTRINENPILIDIVEEQHGASSGTVDNRLRWTEPISYTRGDDDEILFSQEDKAVMVEIFFDRNIQNTDDYYIELNGIIFNNPPGKISRTFVNVLEHENVLLIPKITECIVKIKLLRFAQPSDIPETSDYELIVHAQTLDSVTKVWTKKCKTASDIFGWPLPIKTFMRGKDCQHAQCFDYEHFLFQTEILENCHCPVPYCNKKLLLSDLRRSKGYNAPPVDTLDTFLEDHIKLADEKWSQSKKIHWNECANKFVFKTPASHKYLSVSYTPRDHILVEYPLLFRVNGKVHQITRGPQLFNISSFLIPSSTTDDDETNNNVIQFMSKEAHHLLIISRDTSIFPETPIIDDLSRERIKVDNAPKSSVDVDITCPYTKKPIVGVAVKGPECTHVRCFTRDLFLDQTNHGGIFTCPIEDCLKTINPPSLVRSAFFEYIISRSDIV